jgi:hypothetical protein
MDTIWLASGKSGGGPPQSKTLPRRTVTRVNAKRLGLLQPSGALTKCAYVNMNCYSKRRRAEDCAPYRHDNSVKMHPNSCIMPCLRAWVLARRCSNAASSASMSDRVRILPTKVRALNP